MSSRRFDPLASYIGDVECYTCHNFSHIARKCLLPHYSRKKKQNQQEHSGDSRKPMKKGKKQPKTMWSMKEQKLFK